MKSFHDVCIAPGASAVLEERLGQIEAGPGGATVGAFFDFDGTLIDGFSAAAYVRERLRKREMGLGELSKLLAHTLIDDPSDADFHDLLTRSIRRWAGMPEEKLAALWQALFIKHIAQTVFPEAWALVQAHQRQGHTVAIASSATRYQILPAAREFGIEHVLATPIAVRDGIVTGKLAGAPLWNTGKAAAVRGFAQQRGLDLKASYAYANGDEDIAFLSCAGHPMAVNPRQKLAREAAQRGWPSTVFAQRRKILLKDKLRTTASFAGMAATLLGGMGAHLAGLPQRKALNLVTSLAPELGLALAGVELRILGEQNLWKSRPAVFVFNHQSPLDLVIGVNLLRRDATGVVKAEAAEMMGWGHFMKFADMAFVNRGDPKKAWAALAPAVEKLRKGMSLGICPEGTRSYSPRLGSFKKGAFHMAMQAGVPIVPVVIRNAGEVMHRDAAWIRPGVVDICVLPPVSVQGWTRDTLDRHIADVRQMFIDTLNRWPSTADAKTTRRSLAA